MKKLKHIAGIVGGGTPSREKPEYWNGDIPWVSPKDMKLESIYDSEERITAAGVQNSSTALQPPGSVLMVIRSGILQHTLPIAINEVTVALNQDMKAFSFVDGQCLNRFFFRWIQGLNDALLLAWANEGATVESINQGLLQNTTIPLPPLPEQRAIASFLDRETSKIDALVAEQRKLIELLKEKRQAVISHAVTKGLNPDAPMKDSGIEWLGMVPKHWEVVRLKFLCDLQTGGKDTENANPDGQHPFFVRSQVIERIDSMSFDCEAVLTAGDGVGVGKVFHYHTGPFDFHQRVYMMNNFRLVTGKYFFHYLRENFYKVALEGGAKSTVDSLRRPMLTNFWSCVPPRQEQDAIVGFVEKQLQTLENLTAEAQHSVDILQERRVAFISAAVTGKIDVRDISLSYVANPKSEQA